MAKSISPMGQRAVDAALHELVKRGFFRRCDDGRFEVLRNARARSISRSLEEDSSLRSEKTREK
jgi:hypothetical protein